MVRETITYIDYNGTERTETFYFNLSKPEVVEMELGVDGGLAEHIQRIIDAKEASKIIPLFKEIVLKAYGEKTSDGRRLVKSEEISKAFSETPAYEELFVRLITDEKAAAKFVNSIIPNMEVFTKPANGVAIAPVEK